MDQTQQLRLNSYSAAAGRIQLHREGRRYAQERTALLHVEGDREIIEQLIALVDEPRSLIGTAKSGVAAVLLFACGQRNPVPAIQGNPDRDGSFKLAHRLGRQVTISCQTDGVFDPSAFTWQKSRSPLEVSRGSLPELYDETVASVVRMVFDAGFTWAEIVEQEKADAARFAEFKAKVASGEIKILTDAEREAAEDNELVAAHEGQDISYADGVFACNVLAARKRVALRRQQAAAA